MHEQRYVWVTEEVLRLLGGGVGGHDDGGAGEDVRAGGGGGGGVSGGGEGMGGEVGVVHQRDVGDVVGAGCEVELYME